jgi:hypothetical protein
MMMVQQIVGQPILAASGFSRLWRETTPRLAASKAAAGKFAFPQDMESWWQFHWRYL